MGRAGLVGFFCARHDERIVVAGMQCRASGTGRQSLEWLRTTPHGDVSG